MHDDQAELEEFGKRWAEAELARDLTVLDLESAAVLAVGAVRRHQALELGLLLRIEPADRADRDELLDPLVAAHHRGSPPIVVRSRFIPSRVRDFTVPSGSPSFSEIFDCDSPSKYMSSIT